MNANRYASSRYLRPTHYLGVSPAFWSGAVLVAVALGGMLYYLLTRQLPV